MKLTDRNLMATDGGDHLPSWRFGLGSEIAAAHRQRECRYEQKLCLKKSQELPLGLLLLRERELAYGGGKINGKDMISWVIG